MYRLLAAARLTLVAALLCAGPAALAQSAECFVPTIGDVELVQEELFPEREGAIGWIARTGNKLHIDTRARVLRRELLFSEGERLDGEDLAQSERNLRGQRYLADARIEVVTADGARIFPAPELESDPPCWPSGTEPLTVRVTTRDSWSTSFEGSLRKAGDRWLWSAGIDESNLLGLGKQVGFGYRSEIDRDSWVLSYGDPRVLGSAHQLRAVYRDQSDGDSVHLAAGRPFYGLHDRWAYDALVNRFDQNQPLYSAGEQVGSLRHRRRHYAAGLSRLLHRAPRSAARFHLAFRNEFDDVEVEVRDYGIVQVGASLVHHRFRSLRWVNHDRPADVNLGSDSGVWLGYAVRQESTRPGTSWFVAAHHSQGLPLGGARFLIGRVDWASRVREGIVENGQLGARLQFVDHGARRRALVVAARLQWGVRLDPEVQLRLGVDTGLRGYAVNQFVGDRSVLLSAEYRWFVADDLLGAASLGVAAFVDSGYAWPHGRPVVIGDLHSNVGISLLVARKMLSTRNAGTRIDLAYALDPVMGRSRWVLSFGTTRELGS